MSQWLPRRVTQVPSNLELHRGSMPPMRRYLIDEPLGIVWRTEIVCVNRRMIGEQDVIISMMRPEQADVERRVDSSLDEFLWKLQRIC